MSIYRRAKPCVLSKNAEIQSLLADLHDVDPSCSTDSSVARLTAACRWDERQAVLPDSSQCRLKLHRYWLLPIRLCKRTPELPPRRQVHDSRHSQQQVT